jgi:hypothetical protein
MGEFLKEENLKKLFRDKYLETHHQYLNSISDITATIYAREGRKEYKKECMKAGDIEKIDIWPNICRGIVSKLNNAGKFPDSMMTDTEGETLHFRNLRNSWYHECALANPDDVNIRMQFPAWKIIQSYYAIFSSISSVVRCFNPREDRQGHSFILNCYGNQFLSNPRRKIFFIPPISFILTQDGNFNKDYANQIDWEYGIEHHLPFVQKCLVHSKEKNKIITIAHYMKNLREWATYEDSYLFFRMYSEVIRGELNHFLKVITFAHCVQNEYFLIKLFGIDTLKLQFDRFSSEFKKNIGIEPILLKTRFDIYQKYLE